MKNTRPLFIFTEIFECCKLFFHIYGKITIYMVLFTENRMKNTETLGYLIEKRLNSCGTSFSVYILPLSIYNKQKNDAENSCAHSVLEKGQCSSVSTIKDHKYCKSCTCGILPLSLLWLGKLHIGSCMYLCLYTERIP